MRVSLYNETTSEYIFSYPQGLHIGTILGMLLAGVLCASDLWGGWPSAFYVFGKKYLYKIKT